MLRLTLKAVYAQLDIARSFEEETEGTAPWPQGFEISKAEEMHTLKLALPIAVGVLVGMLLQPILGPIVNPILAYAKVSI